MGWTTALTAVANTTLTAGQWNASVRDNMLETTPGKATIKSRIFVTAGTNAIAERDLVSDIIDVSETSTSTSYVNLATVGPRITLQTGPLAVVWTTVQMKNTSTTNTLMSWAISGETTTAATDNRANECDGGSGGWMDRSTVTTIAALDPGINTFTTKYRVTGGTGTFSKRRIVVMGL